MVKGLRYGAWGPVLKLFERQWFGRVWVLQECAVAEEAVVLIGIIRGLGKISGHRWCIFRIRAAVPPFRALVLDYGMFWGRGGVGRSGRVEKAVSGAHLVAGMCTVV